jgi:hypothetical protein
MGVGFGSCRRRRLCRCGRLQLCKLQLNLPISFKNQLLIIVKSCQGLAKCEQVLWTVIAFE